MAERQTGRQMGKSSDIQSERPNSWVQNRLIPNHELHVTSADDISGSADHCDISLKINPASAILRHILSPNSPDFRLIATSAVKRG